MARRRKTASQNKVMELTGEEVKVAAARMMASALAHQRASGWCRDKPDAKPPNINFFFFTVVSFELVLLSLEQSLRLLLLLHYAIIRDNTNHSPNVLYKALLNKSGGEEGIRLDIVKKANELAQPEGIAPISEKELVACLRKHDLSYSNFRFFQLDHHGRLTMKFEVTTRDVQIVDCLALALIHLNMDEMSRRGIGALLSMSEVAESEMTEDLKEMKQHLMSST